MQNNKTDGLIIETSHIQSTLYNEPTDTKLELQVG